MTPPSELEVARRAVTCGAVTEATLAACLEERRRLLADGVETSLRSLLLERGLDAARWDALAAAPPATPAADGRGAGAPLDLVVGDHVLESLLGRGGMGEVWRARHGLLGTPRAVKLLSPGPPSRLARFHREATALARVDGHPNIVRIHTCGEDPARGAYLVMDLVEGVDLRTLLAREGPLAPARAVRLALGVARALDHMHRARVLHRDLKPANILVRREDDQPLVADFGLAFDERQPRLTATGAVLGTPCYMPPEQARGRAGAPSDVFALGAVLHEMLTGTLPVAGPGSARPRVSPALDDLLQRALALDPARRPTAGALARELEAIAAGAPSPVRRWRAAPLGVVALAGLVAGSVALWRVRQAPAPAPHAPAAPVADRPAPAADPLRTLERLSSPLDAEGAARALEALREVWSAAIARAPRAVASPDAALARALAAAEALRLDAGALRADKQRWLDESAAAWAEALGAALERGTEVQALERLVGLCRGAPAVRPGPALEAALDATRDRLFDAATAASFESGPAATLRAFRFEQRLGHALDRWRPVTPSQRDHVARALVFVDKRRLDPEDGLVLALTALRVGPVDDHRDWSGLRSVAALAPPATWRAFLRQVPGSRAAHAALVVLDPPADLHGALAALEAAPKDDLAPVWLGYLLLRAAEADLRRAPDDPARTLEAARRAADLMHEAGLIFALYQALDVELALTRRLRGPEAALETASRAIARLGDDARARGGVLGKVEEDRQEYVAQLRLERVELVVALGRTAQAEQELTALRDRLAAEGLRGRKSFRSCRTALCRLLRLQGRLAEAERALGAVDDLLEESELLAEAILLARDQGDRARAEALIERCGAAGASPAALRRLREVLDEPRAPQGTGR